MKKFFILEDSEERIAFFKQSLGKRFGGDCEIFISDNVEKAKALFADHWPYDTIFLDHDLDDRVYVDSKEQNTGYRFACWMEENYRNSINNKQIIIHSMNEVGAENIKAVLKEAEIIPFNVLYYVLI